jgi:hypothetical protein
MSDVHHISYHQKLFILYFFNVLWTKLIKIEQSRDWIDIRVFIHNIFNALNYFDLFEC